jgi:hypothetical protein
MTNRILVSFAYDECDCFEVESESELIKNILKKSNFERDNMTKINVKVLPCNPN